MFVFVIVVVSLLAYLGVGILNARYTYGLDMAKAQELRPLNEVSVEYSNKKVELSGIPHSSYCNMSFSTLKYRGCDCGNQTTWRKQHAEIERLKSLLNSYPKVSTKAVFLWWMIIVERFIKGGYRSAPKTEEQKLNEWVGHDYIKNDSRYDSSYKNTWDEVENKLKADLHSKNYSAVFVGAAPIIETEKVRK